MRVGNQAGFFTIPADVFLSHVHTACAISGGKVWIVFLASGAWQDAAVMGLSPTELVILRSLF